MELLQLKYFQESVKNGNFSKTANQFSVPASAVSQSIKRLEKEIGADLFNRFPNKIVPNECGKIFYNKVNIALNALEDGIGEIKSFHSDIQGDISILIESNRSYIVERIAQFKEKYPNVNFIIYHQRPINDNISFDVVISPNDIVSSIYKKIPIINENILLAVPKNHPLSAYSKINIRQLKNEPIVSMNSGTSLHKILVKLFKEVNLTPYITIFCDEPSYVIKYTSYGFGVSLFPEKSWDSLRNNGFTLLPFDKSIPLRTTYLHYNYTKSNKPITLFKDFIMI